MDHFVGLHSVHSNGISCFIFLFCASDRLLLVRQPDVVLFPTYYLYVVFRYFYFAIIHEAMNIFRNILLDLITISFILLAILSLGKFEEEILHSNRFGLQCIFLRISKMYGPWNFCCHKLNSSHL